MKNLPAKKQEAMYAHIQNWESSGQTQRDYSKTIGVPYSQFKYWKGKYLQDQKHSIKHNSTSVQDSFIPLQIKNQIPVCLPEVQITYPNGVVVQCPSSTTLDQLKHLIHIF